MTLIPWELYKAKAEALDALACRGTLPSWKPIPPSLGVVTRGSETIKEGLRPHFFVVEEFDMITCIEISYEGLSWDGEYERVYQQLGPIIALISELGRHRILVDCARIEYLDHVSLNVFFQLSQLTTRENGRFALCNVDQKLLELIIALKLPVRLASER